MPRRARKKSKTGIYHIMLRGINQQGIFEDEEDFEILLQILAEVKAISKCKVFAYCLMFNHCHFLIKVGEESLEQIFKRLGARYVYWYNLKYKRIGSLFQDRFKSETIENDKYFLAVLRYIHQNPVKAGLCKNVSDYKWSSYKNYIGNPSFIDTRFIFKLMSRDEFLNFSQHESSKKFLDYEETKPRVSDKEVKTLIGEISYCENAAEFQLLDIHTRKLYIKKLKEKGASIRQISRLTGISKGIVERS